MPIAPPPSLFASLRLKLRLKQRRKPRPPRRLEKTPASAPLPSDARVQLPTPVDGEGVLVVLNPSSGASVVRVDPEEIIRRRLPLARIRVLGEHQTVAEVVDAAVASNMPPIVLGVCGGDGTVAAAAHVARGLSLPLLAMPGGTFNHFVRAAGINSVDDAIDAFAAGEGVRADVAELVIDDGSALTVLNAGSAGIYPQLVIERERLEDRLGKWLAAAVATPRVLRRGDPFEVVVDGRRAQVWSIVVGVDPNIPHTVAPLRRHRLGGGVLDVRVLHARSKRHAIGSFAFGRRTSAAMRRLGLIPAGGETTKYFTREVTVRIRAGRGQVPGFGHDGEVFVPSASSGNGYEARLSVLPEALVLYAPGR